MFFRWVFHEPAPLFSPFGPCCPRIFAQTQHMKRFRLGKLLNYFFQGLIVLAPAFITAWAVVSLFNLIDDLLPNFLHLLLPEIVKIDVQGNPAKIPGLGFLVVVLIVLVVGYFSSLFFVSKLLGLFDQLLEKTPGIKIIYTTVKDFLEAFAGNKRKFNKPVLVSIEALDVWRIGFITQTDVSQFGLVGYVAVYVPHSYAFSGITYLVTTERIKQLGDLSSADAMKFTISGGVAVLGDHDHEEGRQHAKK